MKLEDSNTSYIVNGYKHLTNSNIKRAIREIFPHTICNVIVEYD